MNKKKWMRLWAAVLTLAMLLTTVAFADETDPTDTETPSEETEESPYAGYAGETAGAASYEGDVPEEIVELVLPTIAEGDETFQFVVDPNKLLAAAGANGRLGEATFGDGILFFPNAGEEGAVSYSSSSDSLTITNKGTESVKVTLSVAITSENSDYDLSATKDFSGDDEGKHVYLALVAGEGDDAETEVLTSEGAEIEVTVGRTDSAFEVVHDAENSKYIYQVTEEASAEDYAGWQSASFHMEGAGNEAAEWTADDEPIAFSVEWAVEPANLETEKKLSLAIAEGAGGGGSTQGSAPTLTVATAIASATGNGMWTINVGSSGMTKVASAKTSTKTLTPTVVTTASYVAPKANYIYDSDAGTITVYVKANASTAPQATYKSTTIVLANADSSKQYTLTFDATATGGPTAFTAVE